MFYSDGGISQVSNPDLKPEKVSSYEVIASHRFGNHLEATASGFYYQIGDLIGEKTLSETDPNPSAIRLENLGKADAKGTELAILGNWSGGLRTRLSYSFTDARDSLTGDRLVNSPQHLAKLNATVPLYREKVFLTVEPLYVSQRIGLARHASPGYGTANVTLFSRHLVQNLELSASLHNLLNARYREPGGPEHVQEFIPQDGRTFLVKLTLHF